MKDSKSKILILPLRLALVILIYGALFKVMHWPYANELMGFGSIFILILYTIRFLCKTNKLQMDYVKLGLVFLWVFNYMSNVFHFIDLPYVLEVLLLILFIWWFIEEGFTYITSRTLIDNKFIKTFYYVLAIVFLLLIVFGSLFKIQHWPYGNIMLTLGILLLSVFLIVDYFAIKKPST